MDIEIFRRKIVLGQYELTQHAKDEAGDDDLDIEDIESVVMTGKIIKTLTKDERGIRYILAGVSKSKKDVEIVCRILPSGKLRVITVYLKW
jgi:hypothetical protein